ncbi:MAG: DUF1273 family protein [Clostridia bacterium]|nr:DUF1273 family protein [Clostridia bacterium]
MTEKNLTCCFTGYRPQKFPFALNAGNPGYIDFENRLLGEITMLINEGCTAFYTGMAMGFDIIAAECVLTAAKIMDNHAVRLYCAIPFLAQAQTYPPDWRARYNRIIQSCDNLILISKDYYSGCYYDRNRFMVNNSDIVLTWFNGSPGGTKYTLDYAKSKLRKIINLHTEW